MKNKSVYFLTQTSIIAALYAVLTILQATLFPESTSAAIKFRASEALTVLALFTPAAPLDMIFGSVASLLAAVTMYLLRNARLFSLPVFACLMPALFNGLIVGFEIAFFFTDGGFTLTGFLFSGGFVAIGELAVLFVLGLPLSVFLEKSKLSKKLFIKR